MAFWHDGQRSRDPKRNYRWVLYNDNIEAYTLKTVSKPSFSVTPTEHSFLNHKYYYPGRVEWNSVSMTLVDPINPDAAATIMHALANSGYVPPKSAQDLVTMSKSGAVSSLGTIRIAQLDSSGRAVETWTLWNAFIIDASFGDLSYEDDGLSEITIELRYDYAYLETAATSKQGANSFFNPGSR